MGCDAAVSACMWGRRWSNRRAARAGRAGPGRGLGRRIGFCVSVGVPWWDGCLLAAALRGAQFARVCSRRVHNPEVAGSNPAPATTKALLSGAFCLQAGRDAADPIPLLIHRGSDARRNSLFSSLGVVSAGETHTRLRHAKWSAAHVILPCGNAYSPAKSGREFGSGADDPVSSGASATLTAPAYSRRAS
jgi:hypothetical protein